MTSASLTNELLCAPSGPCSMQISTECLSNGIITYYIFSLLIFQEIKYHLHIIGRILVYLSCISIWTEKYLSPPDSVWGRCQASPCIRNWEVLLKKPHSHREEKWVHGLGLICSYVFAVR